MRTLSTAIAAMALTLALSTTSCSLYDVPDAKTALGRMPELPEVPEKAETVRGDGDPPVVTLKVGTALREKRISGGDPLPDTADVPSTNLQSVPLTSALEAVLSGTDISISYSDKTVAERKVNLLNLSGSLSAVVERICNAARVFCAYKDGALEILEKDTFLVDLPATDKAITATSSVADVIKSFTGGEVQVDQSVGKIIYKSNYEDHQKVHEYLEELRNGRPLVVMQMYIWEVSLDTDNALGINWSKLTQSGFGGSYQDVENITATSAIAAVTGGISLGALFKGKIDSVAVAGFLASQGVVQTISSPQLTFVSGSESKFTVGGKQRFVSQVGTPQSSTASGATTSSTTTIQTEEISTGLEVKMSGSYDNGVIFSNMSVKISDIISTPTITTGGVTLQLPELTNRELETVLRVRPGDNLLLAGMTSTRDDSKNDNLPLPFDFKAPLRSQDKKQNRELVILIKPSIVLFADDKMIAEAKAEEAKKPLPEPVMIDAQGSRPVSFLAQPEALQTQAEEVSSLGASSGAKPGDPFGFQPANDIPRGPASPDQQLVNSGLLQRGLSYAFDELLLPPVSGSAPAPNTTTGQQP